MAAEQSWFKDSYKSLVGLLQEDRRVNKEFQKRNKGFKIAMLAEAAVFAAYVLIFVVFGMRSFSRDARNMALILCLATILIFALLDVFIWYISIYKPKQAFLKKARAAFPGIDLSSESSIKKYLWTFEDRELLYNLAPLIVWESAIRNAGGFVSRNTAYTPTERVVLDVWKTSDIDRELYDFYHHGEHELSYLEGVVGSFAEIGASDEAQIWAEAGRLFERLEKLDPDADAVRAYESCYICSVNGIDGEARFACGEEERAWLTALKQRHAALREDTEKRLYAFVLAHKEDFKY